MLPDELLDEFEIDQTPIWPADDARLEPIFLAGPPWLEAEDVDPPLAHGAPGAPLPVEFAEFLQLDPERSSPAPDEPPEAPRQRASAISHFGSLGLHLLALLVLVNWSDAPAEIPNALPVQLAFEEPPPGSAPEEAPSRPVPDTETISEKPPETANRAVAAAASPAVPSPQTKPAAITPPPKPSPPPEPAPHQPAVAALPTPAPPALATIQLAAAPREAQLPGPDPARGDYFARLVTLTRDHLDMLPRSFLAGRRGHTILSVAVLDDGTIGRVAVKRSSGYPDIDARIEQIIVAVGRFPPPPERFHRPLVELDFNLTFPDALQQ